MTLLLPAAYQPHLNIRETQYAIKYIRDTFQKEFGRQMRLERISAPLFVTQNSGLNDDLSGIERPVSFDTRMLPETPLQVVQSLAKWKRIALQKYHFQKGEGLYTNMNAIRRDEEVDNLHSIYVDQWDWERVIDQKDRQLAYLQETVRTIFKVIKHMEHEVWYKFPQAVCHLADDVYFITAQALEDRYPDHTPKERENIITREKGCVFIEQIGAPLKRSRQPHDHRAPDYDDWNYNGDLLFWLPSLQQALEISSMGIRVDEISLIDQCRKANKCERLAFPYHKAIIEKRLPYTIGGGIGQSRLCMLLLNKAHIGEVQASIWPNEMMKTCAQHHIPLL